MKDSTARRQVSDLAEHLQHLKHLVEERASESKRQLDELRERIMQLEGGDARMRELELEWVDTYEKFRNLYGRISKRIERAQPEEPEPDATGTPHETTNPAALRILGRR